MKTQQILLMILLTMYGLNIQAMADTTLINTYKNGGVTDTNSPDSSVNPYGDEMAGIVVGNSNVSIDQFGLYSQQLSNGNLRFDIFTSSGTLVYDSGIIATSAESSLQWNYSPTFNLTLNANTTYYFGILSDQNFSNYWNEPAPEVNGLGLTALQSCFTCARGDSGNFVNFNNPTFHSTAWVQESVQILGTAPVPLPASVWLFGAALASLIGLNRRNKLIA
jgi:hypothetical protein